MTCPRHGKIQRVFRNQVEAPQRTFRNKLELATRRFRNQLKLGRMCIDFNWIIREIVYYFDRIRCLLTCDGDLVTRLTTVGELTEIRGANPYAKRTVVINQGDFTAQIFEGGVMVMILKPGETRALAVNGILALTASTLSGDDASIRVDTYQRCLCGDPELPVEVFEPSYIFDFAASTGNPDDGDDYQNWFYVSLHDAEGRWIDTMVADRYLELGVDYEFNAQIDFTDLVLANPTCKWIYIQWGEANFRDPYMEDYFVPQLVIEEANPAECATLQNYPRRVRVVLDPDLAVTEMQVRLSAIPMAVPEGKFIVDWSAFLFTNPEALIDDTFWFGYVILYDGTAITEYLFQDSDEIPVDENDTAPFIKDHSAWIYNEINTALDFTVYEEFDNFGIQCEWLFNDDPLIHTTPPYNIEVVSDILTATYPGIIGNGDPASVSGTPGPGSIPLTIELALEAIDAASEFRMSAVPVAPSGFRLRTDHYFDSIFSSNTVYLYGSYSTQPYNSTIIATFTKGVHYTIGNDQYLDLTAAITGHSPSTDYFALGSRNRITGGANFTRLLQCYLLAIGANEPEGTVELVPKVACSFFSNTLGTVASCFLAAWETSNFRHCLDYFEDGKTANKGFKVYTRVAGVGSFVLAKTYLKGVDYEVTDDHLNWRSATVLYANGPREWELYEVSNTGGSDVEHSIQLAVICAKPQNLITKATGFVFETANHNNLEYLVTANYNSDGINGTDP